MSVTSPIGFVAAGVSSGIRRRKVPDLAVVRSIRHSTGAAMFTTNRVQAAPVKVSRGHISAADPQAIVINSGVANAATGMRGELDAISTASEAARLMGLKVEEVLVLSTGLIGVPLPMDKVRSGLAQAASSLSPDEGAMAAEAILTTDTRPKTTTAPGPGFVVGGMAKGAGMIHPALATMLAVITTDYSFDPGEAIEFLRPAVESSFNRISVDGDCSTNDAVILLGNGASGARRNDRAISDAINHVCHDLATQIVADGEGATVMVTVSVSGAATYSEAVAVARRVSTSSLVKTAAFGRDPNWGRVLAAAGSAAVAGGGFANVDVDVLTVAFNGTKVFGKGQPTGSVPDVSGPDLHIELDLGLGRGEATYTSSDLSYEYVRINAEYTT